MVMVGVAVGGEYITLCYSVHRPKEDVEGWRSLRVDGSFVLGLTESAALPLNPKLQINHPSSQYRS
jgi:hypothetical protein